jgi:foldase protein PrsA
MNVKRLLSLLPLALVGLALAACGGGGGHTSLSPQDIAVVGSEHVTQSEYNIAFDEAKASLAAKKQTFPVAGSSGYQAIKTNIVELLVQQAEVKMEAAKYGVSVSNADVARQIAKIKKTYFGSSQKKYLAGLKQEGFTDSQFQAYVREQLLEQKLYNAVTKSAATTQADIDAYYASNLSQYQHASTRAVQEILVGKNKEQLANQIYAQLKAGASFAALAKKYSQDPGSKDKGGHFTATQGSDVPEFDKAVFATTAKTGQLLKPVNSSQYGWFVIKPVGNISVGKVTTEKQASAAIRKQLEQQKAQQIAGDWATGIAKSFCSGGKIAYAPGYTPSPDPCATLSQPNQTTT